LSGNVRPRDLGVHRADRLQQAQVRPDDALLLGDGVEPPGPRVTVAVDVVTQTWINRERSRSACTVSRAKRSHPASSVGSPARSAALRNRAESSVTPRKREPAPSTPAASAPCTDSGADRYVSRAAIAVGVNPWSASPASTASNSRVSPGVGRRRAANENASSPNPTVPMMSSARSWPSRLMRSVVETPSAVGKGSE
jgi:hypothetical protein